MAGGAGELSMRGTCLCDAVQFEIAGPYPRLYQCHCSLCRKQGGSVSNTALIVAAGKFRWSTGESMISTWTRETGFRSYFCSRCGAPVPNPLRDTGYIWVPSGLLDGTAPLEIAAQLYVDSKAPWDQPPSGGLHFETAPALTELIALLHSRST